MKNNDGPSTN